MSFRPPPKQPEFASLKGSLAQTRQTEHPLYQTIQLLIERLMQMQVIFVNDIADINASINDILSIVNNVADKKRTYVTVDDETLKLPNSFQILAGTGITLDTSVANKITISASSGAYYDSPLTDGDPDETDLIFADGDPIICQVPNVP